MSKKSNNARGIYGVEAEVHTAVKEGFRVKVSIIDLGIYINGMMVFAPNAERDDWWIFTPALRSSSGKYTHTIEFDKQSTLWSEVASACVNAVENRISGKDRQSVTTPKGLDVVFDVDLDTPINLDDIPFG